MAEALTLLELNNMVSEVIDSSFTHSYWLSAEVSEVREKRGCCYLQIVQQEEGRHIMIV